MVKDQDDKNGVFMINVTHYMMTEWATGLNQLYSNEYGNSPDIEQKQKKPNAKLFKRYGDKINRNVKLANNEVAKLKEIVDK